MTTTETTASATGDCTPEGACAVVDDHVQARIGQPAMVVPGALEALQAFSRSLAGILPARTVDLVHIRASQINGCGVCLLGHVRAAKRHGETDERLSVVAGWREAPFFDAAERAALALTEAVTRMADRSDPVSDEVWGEAARHYDEQQLAALMLEIGSINLWNRLNVATRQVAGAHEW